MTEIQDTQQRCMVSAPEITILLSEVESTKMSENRKAHHHQNANTRTMLISDVKALTETMNELGNRFSDSEERKELVAIDTNNILGEEVVQLVKAA